MNRRAVLVPLAAALFAAGILAPPASGDDRFLRAWGAPGAGAGQLNTPSGVTADDAGHVYVADTNNGRIQRFTDHGAFELAFGAGTLSAPRGVAADHAGNVYVADAGRIVRFRSDGTLAGSWSEPGVAAVAVDPAGRVVAVGDGRRIARFSAEGVPAGQGGGAGEFAHPQGVAAAAGDVIYVADDGTLGVQPFVLGAGALARIGGAGVFAGPSGIAIDPVSGDLVVTDRPAGVIQRRTEAGALVSAFGAPGTGAGQFDRPAAVAVDCRGTVFVADTFNHRVQVFGHDDTPRDECPPAARFTATPSAPRTGQSVAFDAGASDDADGRIVRWDWEIQGPERFTAENQPGPALVRTFARAGSYTVRLRVTDDDGNRSARTAALTVAPGEDAMIRGAGTGSRSLLAPWVRVSPPRMSVGRFRRSGVRVTVGNAPFAARSYTVTIRRAGRSGCTVLRRTVKPDARRRTRLRTGAPGLATRMRARSRGAGRRCAARGGRYTVSVRFAGGGAERPKAPLRLTR